MIFLQTIFHFAVHIHGFYIFIISFFQSSSQLFHITYFFIRALYPSSERESKFLRRLFTSSIKSEIRRFHVVVVQLMAKKFEKSATHMYKVVVLRTKHIAFFYVLFAVAGS